MQISSFPCNTALCFKLILISLLIELLTSCSNHYVNIHNIESSMNALVGKPFTKTEIDKLISDTQDYYEYENTLNNGCSWAFLVNKKTNFIESWRVTSDRKLCEIGTNLY